MTTSFDTTQIPGYIAGTWTIDPVHSDVSFKVRHLMVANVRGKFHGVTGTLVLAEDPIDSTVVAEIDLASIDTGNEQRDADLRSARFFDVANYPTMTYRSRSVRGDGDSFVVDGELSLHGIARDVELQVEVNGFGPDPYGGTRAGFTATTELDRRDFGITPDPPFDTVVGNTIKVVLEIEAVLTQPPPPSPAP
ncbi:MAG: YceI family protein [Actinomycetota bacterium]|nr:YceI family protein [Actinomycetota bacterium]